MKVIAMLGDSHTWGEGVGAEYYFAPTVQCSDLRMNPFGFPCYVNLIRNAYELTTDSHANEYYAESLTDMCEQTEGQLGIVAQRPLVFEEDFELCRLFFRATAENTYADICIDDEKPERYELQCDSTGMNKCIRLVNICPEGMSHKLKISSPDGRPLYIQRAEFYFGEYAVINCGVGSCTVERYQHEYFDKYIAETKPYAVVFEGCTVNDWLSGKSQEAYAADLERMIESINGINARLVMHTTFPVMGGSYHGSCKDPYETYVDTARKTAQKCGVMLADCNAEAVRLLCTVPEEKRTGFMYHDKWHPNGTGHYIYAKTVLPYMLKEFI